MNNLNRILLLVSCFAIMASCMAQNSQTKEDIITQININHLQSYQTIEGWGSSLCWWAAQVGNWNEAMVDSIIDIITSPDRLNMNIFRYNIGGGDDPSHSGGHMVKGKGKRAEMEGFRASADAPYDWTADKGQRTIMLKIKEKRPDAVFEAFSNSPPYWMTYSRCAAGNVDPMADNLKPEYYEAFCNYLLEVCIHYKEQYGLEFKTLEPFNESTSSYWRDQGSQEGCHFTPETQMKIIRILFTKLQASGLHTVISASDETDIASFMKVLKVYQSAGDILGKTGQLNTHTYSGTNMERMEAHEMVQATGKPFWQSETGPSGGRRSNFESNLGLAQKLFDDMRIMKPQAWLDWQLMEEGNEVWCLMKCNFALQDYNIVKNLYVRMQVTRFFKQGYTIIETGNEEALAAMNPGKTELVVSIINKSDQPKSINIILSAFSKSGKKIQAYRTSATENCLQISATAVKNKALGYNAPGLSLTTFIIPVNQIL